MTGKTRSLLFLLLSCPLMAVPAVVSPVSAAGGGTRTEAFVEGNTAFALKLYGELRKAEGNIFFSPYSVSSAMGMASAGARGNTEKEMAEALDFRLDPKQIHPAFKSLNAELMKGAGDNGQKLDVANGLCLTGGDVKDEFRSLLKEDYGAELFSGGVEKINAWVKEKTGGKIEKILNGLDANSVCVLLNAIYFQGTWETPFKERDTRDAPFRTSEGRQEVIPFMHCKKWVKFLKKEDFMAASIPYKGSGFEMVILLPREMGGLLRLEEKLTGANMTQWLAELDASAVVETQLVVPKFKLESAYDLVPSFRALGVNDAFDGGGKADFSGMGRRKGGLFISQVKHKAFLEVNERGTEAAAATAVEMSVTAMRKYQLFRADHPFIFVIRDKSSGTILFLGRLSVPEGKTVKKTQ